MERNNFVPHNTEDKNWWCHHGENLEFSFVDICQNQLHLDVQINPEKTQNKYAADLVVNIDGKAHLADLKTQNTPFFTAKRYKIDPRYAVTFNRKDYERYKQLYPNIIIFYWIDWVQTTWKNESVERLSGIYASPFLTMAEKIEAHMVSEHFYLARRNDTGGNAKSSFVFDIREFQCLFASDHNRKNS